MCYKFFFQIWALPCSIIYHSLHTLLHISFSIHVLTEFCKTSFLPTTILPSHTPTYHLTTILHTKYLYSYFPLLFFHHCFYFHTFSIRFSSHCPFFFLINFLFTLFQRHSQIPLYIWLYFLWYFGCLIIMQSSFANFLEFSLLLTIKNLKFFKKIFKLLWLYWSQEKCPHITLRKKY